MDTPLPQLSPERLDALAAPSGAAAPLPQPQTVQAQAQSSASAVVDAQAASAGSSTQDGLTACLALALELAPQVIENLIGRTILGIDRQATAHPDGAHRAVLDSAALALDAYRRKWIKQFIPLLRIALAHPPAADAPLPQADARVCASEQAQFEALLATAGSRRGNPFAPQTYVRALHELIMRSPASPEQRQVWSHYLVAALGTQLAWVYLQLSAVLRNPSSAELSASSAEVDFQSYAQFVFGLGGQAPQDLPALMPEESMMTPQMRALAQEAKQTVKKLRAVLGMPEIDESVQLGDEMTRMMQDIEESERLMLEVNKRGLDPDAPVVDQTSLKVERLLADYRNATTPSLARVPQPVRAALERLQPALEQLAGTDKTLFTQPDHPVRQFLAGVSKRSLLFANESADGFDSFFGPVEKMIEALLQVAPQSGKIYAEALVRLQPVWKVQDQELQRLAEEKERSLARLEVRKQLASRLAFELVSRRDASDTPVAVKQFLMGPWAQVLARAQLHPQHPGDEQRYEYATALLLWSVSLRRAGSRKEDLVDLAPTLIKALRSGLLSIQLPGPEIEVFLSELTKLHEAALASEWADDALDTYPPEPPESADLSGMMMLGAASDAPRPPPAAPSAPSYQSDLNLL